MELQIIKLEKAQAALARVEKESDERIAATRTKLAEIDKRDWRRDQAQGELDSLLQVRDVALKRARENVANADREYQAVVKAQEEKESAIADEKEEKMYNEALKHYVANGGRREDFPESWKAIREQMLNVSIMHNLSGGKRARSHIRF